ncbi:hypothetical protein D9619_012544 [Psilocybe cf. subviscida]|uniref:Uncharacterized protein n=1 Tax=Psilocybe cf. subviscida TaxID=2480587 RepID=A0A8H5B7N0_9AGAR|nr:hypothetical protein D9619_012544 [Psilocybe cf. subviscida]
MSANCQLMSSACALISTPIGTAYDTLGASGLTHSLNEPSCTNICTNPSLLSTVLKVPPDALSTGSCPKRWRKPLRRFIRIKIGASDEGKYGIKTMYITDLLSLGRLRPSVGVHTVFDPHLLAGARYIPYPPLAHALRYVVELCAVFCAVGTGYRKKCTLTGQAIWEGTSGEVGTSDRDGGGDGKHKHEQGAWARASAT